MSKVEMWAFDWNHISVHTGISVYTKLTFGSVTVQCMVQLDHKGCGFKSHLLLGNVFQVVMISVPYNTHVNNKQ